MNTPKCLKFFVGVLCGCCALQMSQAQTTPKGMPNPFRQVGFLQFDAKHSSPRFENGYIVQVLRESSDPEASNVIVQDTSDGTFSSVRVWPKGAVTVWLASASVGVPGQLVLSGKTISDDGSKHNFVAVFDDVKSQAMARVFSTGRYVATQVCQAADGSIWTIGAESPVSENPLSWEPYDVLRHFTKTGALQESLIPRSSFHKSFNIAWMNTAPVFLRTSRSIIFLYDGLNGRVYKYDTSKKALVQWDLDHSYDDLTFTGLALITSGDIYASVKNGVAGSNSLDALFVMRLPVAGQTVGWSPVPGTAGTGEAGALFLLGADGASLVYQKGPSSQKLVSVFWSNP